MSGYVSKSVLAGAMTLLILGGALFVEAGGRKSTTVYTVGISGAT